MAFIKEESESFRVKYEDTEEQIDGQQITVAVGDSNNFQQQSQLRSCHGGFAFYTTEFARGKAERFTGEETDLLVREVKAREQIIYGTSRNPPKLSEVKAAWEEVALIVSSFSGITRRAVQCRKRYNDVRRRGKQKFTAKRKLQVAMAGGPSTATAEPMPAAYITASTLSADGIEGFGGLELAVQAPLAEDSAAGPSREEQGGVVEEEETADQPSSRVRGEARRPRGRPRGRRRHVSQDERPFLAGFTMLERELSRFNQSVRRVNTRLSRLEMLLLPLGRIADSVERLTGAVERFTPATPPSTPPVASVSLASPGPSRRRSRRGAFRLRTRGGRRPVSND